MSFSEYKVKEVKSNLAKLLAMENLQVEFANVETASFDVKNRILLLPNYSHTDQDVIDLFVGHEVSHALFTPMDGLATLEDKPKNFHSFVNVVEDVRIERKIQDRYPGLRKCFYSAYSKLNAADFFNIAERDVDKMLYIDRLNIKAKLGTQIDIQFNEQELQFNARAKKTETFDEVLQLTEEIWEYCKDELEEKSNDNDMSMDDYLSTGATENQNEKDQEDKDTDEGKQSDNAQSGDSVLSGKEQLSDTDDSESDASEGEGDQLPEAKGPSIDDDVETPMDSQQPEEQSGPGALTDIASRKSMRENIITDPERQIGYIDIPKDIKLENFIISHDNVVKELHEHWFGGNGDFSSFARRKALTLTAKEFKTKNQKVINYLHKEFEMKKAAMQYVRSSENKTGVLNTEKLYSYKYNEDIFKKVMSIPNGKNHGIVFFLDWSGSMAENMKGTMEQLLCLALFCKKANIPFSAYAFTSEYEKSVRRAEGLPKNSQSTNYNEIDCSGVTLLELFGDKMNNVAFQNSLECCLAMSSMFERRTSGDFRWWGLPRNYYLGGTPLDSALVVAHKLVSKFKSKNRIEICNAVFLTDGSSHTISGAYSDIERPDYSVHDNLYAGSLRIRDKTARKETEISRVSNLGYRRRMSITKALFGSLRSVTGCTTVGFFIASGSDTKYAYENFVATNSQLETTTAFFGGYDEFRKVFTKEKSVVAHNSGLDEFYILKGGKHLEVGPEELTVDSDATKAQLTTAFKKLTKGKLQNRVILSKFIDKIAA